MMAVFVDTDLRNAHGINLATGEGFMLVFKAQLLALAGYATVAATKKTSIRTSELSKLFRARSLVPLRKFLMQRTVLLSVFSVGIELYKAALRLF